ncbi:MAG: hypothetical protein J0651_03170 [Actinobacteria bacterium]|nr:hypothetical protein [Actinomycetota bacterium]
MSSFDLAFFESELFDLDWALKACKARYLEANHSQKAQIRGVFKQITRYVYSEEFTSKCVLSEMTTRMEELRRNACFLG